MSVRNETLRIETLRMLTGPAHNAGCGGIYL